jgi:hypothetical protein
MRLHRRSRMSSDHHNQKASTSHELTTAEEEHRRRLFRPNAHNRRQSDNEEEGGLFFVREDNNNNVVAGAPRLYTGSHSASTSPQSRGTSTASVIVFAFALSGILLVFLLFYFLAKICAPNDEDMKDTRSESNHANGGSMIRHGSTPRKLASGGE